MGRTRSWVTTLAAFTSSAGPTKILSTPLSGAINASCVPFGLMRGARWSGLPKRSLRGKRLVSARGAGTGAAVTTGGGGAAGGGAAGGATGAGWGEPHAARVTRETARTPRVVRFMLTFSFGHAASSTAERLWQRTDASVRIPS